MNFGKLTINSMFYVKSFGLIAKVQYVAGKIGPPKLSLSRDVNKIVVNIYHPAFPSVELLPWITEVYSDLTYSVTFRDSENKVSSKVKTSTQKYLFTLNA